MDINNKCTAICRNGNRCKNKIKIGTYCHIHIHINCKNDIIDNLSNEIKNLSINKKSKKMAEDNLDYLINNMNNLSMDIDIMYEIEKYIDKNISEINNMYNNYNYNNTIPCFIPGCKNKGFKNGAIIFIFCRGHWATDISRKVENMVYNKRITFKNI